MSMNIGVTGVSGRMGASIVAAVIDASKKDSTVNLSAAYQYAGGKFVGQDVGLVCGLGNVDLLVSGDLDDTFDVLVDFSTVDASLENLEYCALNDKAIVLGVTGYSDKQKQLIEKYSEKIPVVLAPI